MRPSLKTSGKTSSCPKWIKCRLPEFCCGISHSKTPPITGIVTFQEFARVGFCPCVCWLRFCCGSCYTSLSVLPTTGNFPADIPVAHLFLEDNSSALNYMLCSCCACAISLNSLLILPLKKKSLLDSIDRSYFDNEEQRRVFSPSFNRL